MKFRTIKISELNSIVSEALSNDNTIGPCSIACSLDSDQDKIDYSTVSLISMMHEKNFLKHEMIEESFETAKNIINSYEAKNES